MVLKFFLCCRQKPGSRNLERAEQSEQKEDDLDSADDGESRQESHGASDETQLGLDLDLLVSPDVVEGGCVKEDLHQLKSRMRKLFS